LKFKFLVIIFNTIIIFFLSAIALLPLIFLGPDFALGFWRTGWPLAGILAAALIGLNVFFLANRRLFRMLEREDWPALVDYLEQEVIGKGHYAPRKVKLLLNSYLVMGEVSEVLRLESKLIIAKPALVDANAQVLGAARIFGGDPKGAVEFFRTRLSRVSAKDSQWLHWYYGFSNILAGAFSEAETEFKPLAQSSSDALITGLSAYFLASTLRSRSAGPSDCEAAAEEGRKRVRQALKNTAGWRNEASKLQAEVHTLLIKKYLDEAGNWIFG
jgi:hypothetical protein